jgi:hypothetical protein
MGAALAERGKNRVRRRAGAEIFDDAFTPRHGGEDQRQGGRKGIARQPDGAA